MVDERYVRWQGMGIAQLSVAVALISAWSVTGLGAGFQLLRTRDFAPSPPFKLIFLSALFLLLVAALCGFGSIITRLLDFRLTARQVRKKAKPDYDKPTEIFSCDSEQWGNATWRLFWVSCSCFALGVIAFFSAIGATYVPAFLD